MLKLPLSYPVKPQNLLLFRKHICWREDIVWPLVCARERQMGLLTGSLTPSIFVYTFIIIHIYTNSIVLH